MPGYRSSTAKMVGSTGVAMSQIDRAGGEIKVDGQSWSARPYSSDVVIEQGTEIEVYEIDGAIAVVYPKHGQLPYELRNNVDIAQLIVTLAIALAVIFFIGNAVRVIRQQRVGLVERLGKFNRTLEPGPAPGGADPGQGPLQPGHAGERRPVPAAGRDHRGQPDGQHRLGDLLPDHRPGAGGVRGPGLHQGDRAADHDHAAQHHRRPRPGADADQPRGDQPEAAHRARRGDRQVGDQGQPGGAAGHRAAGHDPRRHGEGCPGRARQAGRPS